MVSIVMPTYNGQKYIREALNSITEQTYKEFELIIVDDCSTDGTPKIVQEYAAKDSRIKVIRNESNQKLPKSLNIGFTKCIGDYFTWTSDDNLYHMDALKRMVEYLENDKNTNFVYACEEFIDENGKSRRN